MSSLPRTTCPGHHASGWLSADDGGQLRARRPDAVLSASGRTGPRKRTISASTTRSRWPLPPAYQDWQHIRGLSMVPQLPGTQCQRNRAGGRPDAVSLSSCATLGPARPRAVARPRLRAHQAKRHFLLNWQLGFRPHRVICRQLIHGASPAPCRLLLRLIRINCLPSAKDAAYYTDVITAFSLQTLRAATRQRRSQHARDITGQICQSAHFGQQQAV